MTSRDIPTKALLRVSRVLVRNIMCYRIVCLFIYVTLNDNNSYSIANIFIDTILFDFTLRVPFNHLIH